MSGRGTRKYCEILDYEKSYDLYSEYGPEGKRFLMVKEAGSSSGGPRKINIFLNWLDEQKQRPLSEDLVWTPGLRSDSCS